MIFGAERNWELNSLLLCSIKMFKSSLWNTMDISERGCLANMELNPFHRNGLVCIKTSRICDLNMLLVLATLRILV